MANRNDAFGRPQRGDTANPPASTSSNAASDMPQDVWDAISAFACSSVTECCRVRCVSLKTRAGVSAEFLTASGVRREGAPTARRPTSRSSCVRRDVFVTDTHLKALTAWLPEESSKCLARLLLVSMKDYFPLLAGGAPSCLRLDHIRGNVFFGSGCRNVVDGVSALWRLVALVSPPALGVPWPRSVFLLRDDSSAVEEDLFAPLVQFVTLHGAQVRVVALSLKLADVMHAPHTAELVKTAIGSSGLKQTVGTLAPSSCADTLRRWAYAFDGRLTLSIEYAPPGTVAVLRRGDDAADYCSSSSDAVAVVIGPYVTELTCTLPWFLWHASHFSRLDTLVLTARQSGFQAAPLSGTLWRHFNTTIGSSDALQRAVTDVRLLSHSGAATVDDIARLRATFPLASFRFEEEMPLHVAVRMLRHAEREMHQHQPPPPPPIVERLNSDCDPGTSADTPWDFNRDLRRQPTEVYSAIPLLRCVSRLVDPAALRVLDVTLRFVSSADNSASRRGNEPSFELSDTMREASDGEADVTELPNLERLHVSLLELSSGTRSRGHATTGGEAGPSQIVRAPDACLVALLASVASRHLDIASLAYLSPEIQPSTSTRCVIAALMNRLVFDTPRIQYRCVEFCDVPFDLLEHLAICPAVCGLGFRRHAMDTLNGTGSAVYRSQEAASLRTTTWLAPFRRLRELHFMTDRIAPPTPPWFVDRSDALESLTLHVTRDGQTIVSLLVLRCFSALARLRLIGHDVTVAQFVRWAKEAREMRQQRPSSQMTKGDQSQQLLPKLVELDLRAAALVRQRWQDPSRCDWLAELSHMFPRLRSLKTPDTC